MSYAQQIINGHCRGKPCMSLELIIYSSPVADPVLLDNLMTICYQIRNCDKTDTTVTTQTAS